MRPEHLLLQIGKVGILNQELDKRKSFTLVEVMISLFIISLTVVGLTALFISGEKFNKYSTLRLQAANLAQQTLDSLREEVNAATWSGGPSRLDFNNPHSTTFTAAIDANTFVVYNIVWTVSLEPGTMARKVIASISWSPP